MNPFRKGLLFVFFTSLCLGALKSQAKQNQRLGRLPGAALIPNHFLETHRRQLKEEGVPDLCGSDGSSIVPDSMGLADFRPACQNHDDCYEYAPDVEKKTCDTNFYYDLVDECHSAYPSKFIDHPNRHLCLHVARLYYFGVKHFGDGPFERSRERYEKYFDFDPIEDLQDILEPS